MKRVEHKSKYL